MDGYTILRKTVTLNTVDLNVLYLIPVLLYLSLIIPTFQVYRDSKLLQYEVGMPGSNFDFFTGIPLLAVFVLCFFFIPIATVLCCTLFIFIFNLLIIRENQPVYKYLFRIGLLFTIGLFSIMLYIMSVFRIVCKMFYTVTMIRWLVLSRRYGSFVSNQFDSFGNPIPRPNSFAVFVNAIICGGIVLFSYIYKTNSSSYITFCGAGVFFVLVWNFDDDLLRDYMRNTDIWWSFTRNRTFFSIALLLLTLWW